MEISQHPIRITIIFGLICGLSFIPANLALNYVLRGPSVIYLTLWLYAAGYSLLLSHWSKKPILSIGFPLLLLFVTSILVDSMASFYFISVVVISWIRTGICFRIPCGKKFLVELLLCVLGGIQAALFRPGSALDWVLGIWMFFLIQSLYFVMIENNADRLDDQYETDPFERASRQAESILSDF